MAPAQGTGDRSRDRSPLLHPGAALERPGHAGRDRRGDPEGAQASRYHPTVDGDFTPCFAYAGKGNLYYCTDCEGPELFGRNTVVIGAGPADWAASMAVGLSRYTDRMRVLLTGDRDLSEKQAARLREKNIPVLAGEIRRLIGERRRLSALELADGTMVQAEAFFVSSPARGRTDLASQLGVELASTGYHAHPKSQRGDTSVPGVWIRAICVP